MDALEARGSALQRATSLYDLISGEAAAGERLGRLTDPVASALLGNQMLAIFDAPLPSTASEFLRVTLVLLVVE